MASSGVRATNPGRQRPPAPRRCGHSRRRARPTGARSQLLPPGGLSFICSPSQDTPLLAADPGPWDIRCRAGPRTGLLTAGAQDEGGGGRECSGLRMQVPSGAEAGGREGEAGGAVTHGGSGRTGDGGLRGPGGWMQRAGKLPEAFPMWRQHHTVRVHMCLSVCTCACTRLHVCTVCTCLHACFCVCTSAVCTCAHVTVRVHMSKRVHLCLSARVHCLHVCMSVCVFVHVHVCSLHVCMCTCVHM